MSLPAVRSLLSFRAKRVSLVGAAIVLGVAVCLLAMLALPKPANACSCAPVGSPAEALAEADAVFAGDVTAITPLGHPPFRLSTADPVAVKFRVSRVWKGPIQDTQTVQTEASGISCGFEFKEGQNYIVYTREGNRTWRCTRTAPAWMAFADFLALGPGQRPQVSPDAEAAGGGACTRPASMGPKPLDIASVSLLAGAIALGVRRRPRL